MQRGTRRALWVLALALFVAASTAVQPQSSSGKDQKGQTTPPDLSGTWKLNREKSDLRVWEKATPELVIISQSDKVVKFERHLDGRVQLVSYVTDCSTQHISGSGHYERLARACWKKGILVIDERLVGHWGVIPDNEAQATQNRWKISDDGKVLTESEPERATTAVFDLQR